MLYDAVSIIKFLLPFLRAFSFTFYRFFFLVLLVRYFSYGASKWEGKTRHWENVFHVKISSGVIKSERNEEKNNVFKVNEEKANVCVFVCSSRKSKKLNVIVDANIFDCSKILKTYTTFTSDTRLSF